MKNSLKPFAFPLLVAAGVASALYWAGNLAMPYVKKASEQELRVLAHQVAEAYVLSQETQNQEILTKALNQCVVYSNVIATLLRSPTNSVVGFSRKPEQPDVKNLHQFSIPLTEITGKEIGTLIFELKEDIGSGTRELRQKIMAVAVGGLILTFLISFYFFNRSDPFLNEFIKSLQQVSEGNLETPMKGLGEGANSALVEAFNQMLEGLRERDRMRHSLGRIMDPKIAEILIKEDPKLGGLRRQTTILFCDIRNYTSLCEQMSAEELETFLNEYWKDTVEIIMEQEGTIDKFHGDGVCVVFGAPVLHPDDSLRAVRTAWRLVQNVELINKRREEARKTPIQIGVGIHTGEVIAGHIGSERRMDYTVVGDAVNVAARIEELNKKFGTKILISDNVYEQVETHVRVKTLTLAYLRGHKRPILIHALREFFEEAVPSQEEPPQQLAA